MARHTHTEAVKRPRCAPLSAPAVTLYMGKSNRVFNRLCHRGASIIFQPVITHRPQETRGGAQSTTHPSSLCFLFTNNVRNAWLKNKNKKKFYILFAFLL